MWWLLKSPQYPAVWQYSGGYWQINRLNNSRFSYFYCDCSEFRYRYPAYVMLLLFLAVPYSPYSLSVINSCIRKMSTAFFFSSFVRSWHLDLLLPSIFICQKFEALPNVLRYMILRRGVFFQIESIRVSQRYDLVASGSSSTLRDLEIEPKFSVFIKLNYHTNIHYVEYEAVKISLFLLRCSESYKLSTCTLSHRFWWRYIYFLSVFVYWIFRKDHK